MYLFLVSTSIVWDIPPLIPFSTINISISIKRFYFTLVFFKVICHANSGAAGNQAGSSSYIFQKTYFESSKIHQLMIMDHFKCTNHILLIFLF